MKKELLFAASLLAYAIARLLPPVAGLSEPGQAALGVTLAGTILWISEAVPLGVTALLVIVLLAINPGMHLPDALVGFTSEVTFFLVGVAAIGTAVEASGLAQRAARFLAKSARGNPTRLYAQMIVSLPAPEIISRRVFAAMPFQACRIAGPGRRWPCCNWCRPAAATFRPRRSWTTARF
jgi:sodium-dependent dicarboxylate transporter 2/3/5